MNYIQYITQEGERWDWVSWKAYGTISKVADIIAFNPTLPITEKLQGGTIVNIPVLETADVQISKELLPPWKREL